MYKIIIIFFYLSMQLFSVELGLNKNEKEYIKNHPIIKVHNELDWAPYNYNKDGKPYGFSIDYIKLVASKVGLKVKFVSGYTWSQFLQLIKENKIDVMLNIAKTKEREKYLIYTSPYYNGIDVVFTSNNSHYRSLKDFNGKRIAIVKGFYEEELLKRYYKDITIVTTKNSLESLKLLSFGKVDGMIDNLATGNYLKAEYGLSNIKANLR